MKGTAIEIAEHVKALALLKNQLVIKMDKPCIGIAHVLFVIKLVEKKLVWNGFVALVAEALEDRLKHVPVVMEKGGLTNELSYTLTLVGV